MSPRRFHPRTSHRLDPSPRDRPRRSGRRRLHPFVVLDLVGEVPGMSRADRRRVAAEAVTRADAAAGTPDHVEPGRLVPPAAPATGRRVLHALPVALGLAAFFGVAQLAPPIDTSAGLIIRAVAFVVMLGLVWLLAGAVARPVYLPYAWAVLRERGIDVCLHCGGIGAGTGLGRTRCPECGRLNPPAPREDEERDQAAEHEHDRDDPDHDDEPSARTPPPA